MNTKLLLILIILILMFPQSASIGASFQIQIIHVQNHMQVITPDNNKQNHGLDLDLTFDWSYTDSVHHGHQSDGDNKLHHFHYNRFLKSRKRKLFSILFKILLVITYISSLLSASIHMLY